MLKKGSGAGMSSARSGQKLQDIIQTSGKPLLKKKINLGQFQSQQSIM